MAFIRDFNLWTESQTEEAKRILDSLEEQGVPSVRVGFVDQHGLVRAKNIVSQELSGAFTSGVSFASTLLSKGLNGITIFSAFDSDGGIGKKEMAGAADIILVPDPETFRTLPWLDNEGWIIGDLYFKDGTPVPFSSRGILKEALTRTDNLGFHFVSGVELEFHLFKTGDNGNYTHLNSGKQLLLDDWNVANRKFTNELRSRLTAARIPISTTEVEYGPSQLELTSPPAIGIKGADNVVLLRSIVKQLAQEMGFHATFMSRPHLAESMATGWHLHQGLLDKSRSRSTNNVMTPSSESLLSPLGDSYVAGLLKHAAAGCLFSVPTITGYKRFQQFAMAPDRIAWAADNRGAMIRVLGTGQATHIENRVGDPSANPYLYMASQLVAGLRGIRENLVPPPPSENPYLQESEMLPATLGEAIRALEQDEVYRSLMGEEFCSYYLKLKKDEFARFNRHVTDWEHAEYFDLY